MTLVEIGGLVLELVESSKKINQKIDSVEASIMNAVAKGFEEVHTRIDTVDRKIEAVAEDISKFKDESSESFRKVRNDIWSLDERFVTKPGFKLG